MTNFNLFPEEGEKEPVLEDFILTKPAHPGSRFIPIAVKPWLAQPFSFGTGLEEQLAHAWAEGDDEAAAEALRYFKELRGD